MIGGPGTGRVFARAAPTDLRLGFAGLSGLVRRELGRDLLEGDWFLFVSRRRDSARVLRWDGTGLVLVAKRLAGRRFAPVWARVEGGVVRLSMGELLLFLDGVEAGPAASRSAKKARSSR